MTMLIALFSFQTISTATEITIPIVQTNPPTEITNTSVTLQGYLVDDGGENCSAWFEWDDYPLGNECAGLIATGTVVKDGRSIFWKNRHFYANNQKPRFYQGNNYSYYGVGQTDGMCRMGINEKGLAVGNFDIYGNVDAARRSYLSDRTTGGEDADMHYILGNFSTVYDAATHLAQHGTYMCQLGIVSAEKGVGAIVTIGNDGYTNITWVNNTWIALGNDIQCNGRADYKMIRIQNIIHDIQNNLTSSEGDNLINWRDVAQRFARDIPSGVRLISEPYGYTGSYYASGISPSTARSAMIAVCGNNSYDGALNMAWLAFGQTTHLSIFLPLGASYLHSLEDIPSAFTEGNGLETYTDVKQAYAEVSPDRYNRSRVHEIHTYTFHNENLTFDEYDTVMDTILTSADENEAKERIETFADTTMQTALQAYSENLTTYSTTTNPTFPLRSNQTFTTTRTNLTPGTVYYYRACANNSESTTNGSQMRFMTQPNAPENLIVRADSATEITISFYKGDGASTTIIERNTQPTPWQRGEGIQIYNGNDIHYEDSSLHRGTQYYYQLWSYTTAEGEQQYSSPCASGNTKTLFIPNNQHLLLNPTPDNTSLNISITIPSLIISIEDPEGDLFNWTIETSPNIGSSFSTQDYNGSKTCAITNLQYETTYYWFVNVTDGLLWTNATYSFTTSSEEESGLLWVDDNYTCSTPGWHTTRFNCIQDAIIHAAEGNTIQVYPGIYHENIWVYKTVHLLGNDPYHTIIDGNNNGDVLIIIAPAVSIKGFTIQNSGNNICSAGIRIIASRSNVSDCIIVNNRYGVNLFISSNQNILFNNTITENKYGIELYLTCNNQIKNNILTNNKYGLYFDYRAQTNTITGNTISENNKYGVYIESWNRNNLFSHNQFLNNRQNANDKDINGWYNTTLHQGNYWSDYTGSDANNDGIGDTPYRIPGGNNRDRYPLMQPFQ